MAKRNIQVHPRVLALFVTCTIPAIGCFSNGIQSKGHGWSEQATALDGSRLIAFSTSETKNNRTTKQWLCHVLLDYPDAAEAKRVVADGSGRGGGDHPLFEAHWTLETNEGPVLKQVEMRFDVATNRLHIEGRTLELVTDQSDAKLHVPKVVRRSTPGAQPFSVENANLFLVRLGPEYDMIDIEQLDSRISDRATVADFQRLLPTEAAIPAAREERDSAAGRPSSNSESARDSAFVQTKEGVTVRLQKVTVERIYDLPGFLNKHYPVDHPHKVESRELLTKMAEDEPLRLICLLLAYTGPIKGVNVDIRHPDFDRRIGGETFVSNNWQRRLTHLKVDDGTSGAEVYTVAPASVSLDQLFPCDVEVNVTTTSGSELQFVMRDVPW